MEEVKIKVKKSDKINSLNNVECGKCFVSTGCLNGGYGCIFGDKEDAYKCYHWNCPFAVTADLNDILTLEPDSFESVASDFGLNPKEALLFPSEKLQEYDTSYFSDDYMHQFYEIVEIEMDDDELNEYRAELSELEEEAIGAFPEKYNFVIVEEEYPPAGASL